MTKKPRPKDITGRGGPGRGQGAKRRGAELRKPRNLTLTDSEFAKAQQIGGGVASLGVSKALDQFPADD